MDRCMLEWNVPYSKKKKKTTLPNLIQRKWIAVDIAIRVSGENFQAEKIWLTADALRFSLCIRCFSFQELRKLNVPRPVSLFSTFFHGVSLRQKTRSGRPGLEKGVTRLDKTCFLAREETISEPGVRRNRLAALFSRNIGKPN